MTTAPVLDADSAGIAAADPSNDPRIPLANIAPHPFNPRKHLGDLTELAESIRLDDIFEPLILLTLAAYEAAADPDEPTEPFPPKTTHIVLMGHRRRAAALLAQRLDAPYRVRDDLAGPRAIAMMIAENRHRESLTPIAEAEGFARLARAGWSQRQIAAPGARLPDALQDAIALPTDDLTLPALGPRLAAARALYDAALPHVDDWTPELHAAIVALRGLDVLPDATREAS